MSRKKSKRASLLGNIERRNESIRATIEARKPDIPEPIVKRFREVERKTAEARENIDLADADYVLEVASSAQSMFVEESARVGFLVRSGGWKTHRLAGLSEQHRQWAVHARGLLTAMEDYPRGTKIRVAEKVAQHFSVDIETVRKRLRTLGVFDGI